MASALRKFLSSVPYSKFSFDAHLFSSLLFALMQKVAKKIKAANPRQGGVAAKPTHKELSLLIVTYTLFTGFINGAVFTANSQQLKATGCCLLNKLRALYSATLFLK